MRLKAAGRSSARLRERYFVVGGLPCQVDSGNERDLSLLNSHARLVRTAGFLEGLSATSRWKCEAITGL